MNNQRCWGNSAIRLSAATIPTSVPNMRMAALLNDWPAVERLTKATANAAQ